MGRRGRRVGGSVGVGGRRRDVLGGLQMSVAAVMRSGSTRMVQRAGLSRSWLRRYASVLIGLDTIAGICAGVAAYILRFSAQPFGTASLVVGQPVYASTSYLWFSLALPACWVGAVTLARAYEVRF